MKLLSIHADRISYKARTKTKIAEPTDRREDSMEQCMVFFSCVERMDEVVSEKVVEDAVESVIKRLDQVKVKDLMIFPFAHLAPALSSSDVALWILGELESSLAKGGYNVKRAPFGWHKEFEIKAKGHPMAVQSLNIHSCDREQGDIFCPYCGNSLRNADLFASRSGTYPAEKKPS
jgi:threonyl-tRNA synthetase